MVDRKENILKAAEQTFASFGYKATTMDLVARMANVGKGTIYTFFTNKEDLFFEIMKQFIEKIKKVASSAIHDEDDFFTNLHRALYSVLEFRKEHQLTIKLTQEIKEIGTVQAKQALGNVEDAILDFLEGNIKNALKKGEIKTCDPKVTAFVILRLYIALVFDWELRHAPLSSSEIADLFGLYLVRGLKK
ncbi:TetR/AcrR family transcriptional regulator [Sporolactobacillus sp. Y61]|jgi:AcrR family transcriptional regulator|uniref:TetR/AcrR family transcriptional regulator n=1 Tax=Sporolactobacillus sp. Y61 TaxID=3160863 RepID=A0AAU8IBS2_9BACL|nr:TetR/AcrR family transcriptional regulator [Sporolactobacillus sp. THM19-2]RYL91521.1 TetR/AcrR family transcriptional regulator [Sporolactobacillus sp. THM19-2]